MGLLVMSPSQKRQARPWYAFLYRHLGASGTFWLWMTCLAGFWIYGGEAFIALLNQQPVSRSVANAASGQELGCYWVKLQGLELKDARKLLGQSGASGTPVRLLLDNQDPAAKTWRQLSNLAFELSQKNLDKSRRARRVLKVKEFERLQSQFQRDRKSYLPTQPIRLFEQGDPALVTSDLSVGRPSNRIGKRAKNPAELVREAQRDLEASIQLVKTYVSPNVEVQGLLDSTPKSLKNRVFEELGLGLSGQTLRINREPSFLPLWIVSLSVLLLVFLTGGFLSATRESGAEGAPESSLLSGQDEASHQDKEAFF